MPLRYSPESAVALVQEARIAYRDYKGDFKKYQGVCWRAVALCDTLEAAGREIERLKKFETWVRQVAPMTAVALDEAQETPCHE